MLVGAATNGFTLADTRTVKAVFGVPDTAIARVKLGSPQTVTTEALPNPFSGHVTSISAAADPKSRVYSVEVRIDNPQNLLKSGMIASITIGTGQPISRVTVVPVRCGSQSREPEWLCGVRDRSQWRHRESAHSGRHAGRHLRQHDRGVNGVTLRDRVVTSGTNMIKNGDQVRIIP